MRLGEIDILATHILDTPLSEIRTTQPRDAKNIKMSCWRKSVCDAASSSEHSRCQLMFCFMYAYTHTHSPLHYTHTHPYTHTLTPTLKPKGRSCCTWLCGCARRIVAGQQMELVSTTVGLHGNQGRGGVRGEHT